jgi:aminoglycoside 6'-N-acetyltransferase I
VWEGPRWARDLFQIFRPGPHFSGYHITVDGTDIPHIGGGGLKAAPFQIMINVRPVTPLDADAWLAMRQALWPDEDLERHRDEIRQFLQGRLQEPLQVLLALDPAGTAIGFVELSIRAYAEGCESNRVAYLEGWYVVPQARRQGVGSALVRAAEDWGRSQGCGEFGSDALLDNDISAAAHRALGFTEIVQIRCFRKPLRE